MRKIRLFRCMVGEELKYAMNGLAQMGMRISIGGPLNMGMKKGFPLNGLTMMDRIRLKIVDGQTGKNKETIGELAIISKSAKYRRALQNGPSYLEYLQIQHLDDMQKGFLWKTFFMMGGCKNDGF